MLPEDFHDHVLNAGEAGLLYIIRPDDTYSDRPFFMESQHASVFRRFFYERAAKELSNRGADGRAAKAYLGLARSQDALGDPDKAQAARLSAISLFSDPRAANRQAAEYIQSERLGYAKELLLGLTSSDPERPEYLTNLVIALINLEEFEAARDRCRKLLRLWPDTPDPYLLRILVELESGDLVRAERALKEASERFPKLDKLSHFERMMESSKAEAAERK